MSLSWRYITAIVSLVMVSCVLVAGSVVYGNLVQSEKLLQNNGLLTAALLGQLAEDNPDAALASALTNPQVFAAALYDQNFNLVASKTSPNAPFDLPAVEDLQSAAIDSARTKAPAADVDAADETITALAAVDSPRIRWAVVMLSAATPLEQVSESVGSALLVTVAVSLVGGLVGFLIARRIARPIKALGAATLALESGDFDPATLGRVVSRKDELGALARQFTEMATEVQSREQRLATELEALQVQIDQNERQRSVDTITNTASFAELEKRAAQLRARRANQEGNPTGEVND